MRFTSLTLASACLLALTLFVFHGRVAQSQDTKQVDKKEPEKKQPDKKQPTIDKLDEDILRRADLSANADVLLAFLRKRSLPENDRAKIEQQVRRLHSANFTVRERATLELVKYGVTALEILRAFPTPDLESKRRIETIMQRIHEKDVAPGTTSAAVRVLAHLKPQELVEALLEYLPFNDNEAVVDEIRYALSDNALVAGKAHARLVAALADRSPIRRATAAEVLGRVAFAEHKDALRKLLTDANAEVRYRTARTLALAKERDAVPVLIDAMAKLPINEAWRAEDFLLKLAPKSPPDVAMGNSEAARARCAEAWRAWWKEHGAKADLAKLEETPRMLGRTLIVLLDQREVIELGADNQPRWEVKNINFPLDAQLLGEDRLLVAEYNSNRVIERNLRGEVLWHRNVAGPLAVQRLANGNTFIATATNLLEYDKNQNEVVNITLSEDGTQTIMKAMKADNGDIVCMLTDSRVVRFDAKGNEKSSFPITIAMRLFGGRVHALPNGRVLVPHHAEGKVAEYDRKGKIVWEAAFEQPVAATRLPNGNTLITSMDPNVGAVEIDRTGAEVWSYRHSSNTRVTRAIRR